MKAGAIYSVTPQVCGMAVLLAALNGVPVMNGTLTNRLTGQGESQAAETKRSGDPERGRELFHGRAICSTCHGIDGNRSQLPLMTPNAARAIAGLRPPPANLRDDGTLKLKTDQERFEVIRTGHLFTRMEPVPEQVLSDREIEDLLAYLAILRGETARPSVP